MADLTLQAFPRIDNGRPITLSVPTIIRPFRPVIELRAVLERLSARGVDGYRNRLNSLQPAPIAVQGILGASTQTELDSQTGNLRAIDGAYGEAIFTQAGDQYSIDVVQIESIVIVPSVARLLGASTTYDYTADITLEMTPQVL